MADRKELEIDGKPLSSLRVVDLKMELEKRGMSKSGSKKELSDRLKMQLQLEKLHESASTDEGHVPNLRLQDDEIAEHNDIIKDYLAKQQQIYEMQKEAIRRVELERVRDSEASAGDTSQEEEELEPNQSTADKPVKPCGLDLTVASQNKASPEESAASEEIENASPAHEEKDTVVDTPELEDSKTEMSPPEEQAVDMTMPELEEKRNTEPTDGRNVTFGEVCPSSEVSEEPSLDRTVIENPEMDSDEIAAAVSEIENTVPATDYMEIQEEQDTAAAVSVAETAKAVEEISVSVHEAPAEEMEHIQMREEKEEAAEADSSVLELHVATDDPVTEPKNVESLESEEVVNTKNEDTATEVIQTDISADQKDSIEQPTEMQVETESVQVQEEEHKTIAAEKISQSVENPNRSPPKHRPKLKRRNDWGTSSSAPLVEKDQQCVTEKPKGSIDSTDQEKEDQSEPVVSKEEEEKAEVEVHEKPAEEDQRQEDIEDVTKEESHHVKSPSEKEQPKEMDSPEERCSEKTEEDTRDGNNSQRSPSRDSSEYERPSRNRRRTRHSSTDSSSSSKNSSGSRSRSRSSDSDTSRSESRSPSGSRSHSPREQKNVPFVEESMETYEDSASRQSPRPTDEKMEPQEERVDVNEMSPVEAVAATEDVSGSNHAKIAKAVEPVQAPEGPVKISSRKISLSSSKEKKEKSGDGKENEGTAGGEGEKMQRKRRWGGSGAIAATDGKKMSLSISTDSLKGLIPDVKPLSVSNSGTSEPVLELSNDAREVSEADNELLAKEEATNPSAAPQQSTLSTKREAIIYRTVMQGSNSSVVKDKSSEAADKDLKKGKRLILRNSTSITLSEDKSTARRSPSPARYPPSCIVHIRNLVRPFTLNQLKELLAKTGTLVEGGFWIDKIKSKCYVTYESEDQAIATRQALHGVQWPSSNPKRLIVDYASQDELEFHRSLTDAPEVKRMVQTGASTTVKEWPPPRSPPPVAHRKASMAADVEPPVRQHRDSRRSEREKEREKEKKEQRHNSSRLASGGTRNEKGTPGKEREGERSKGREREAAVPGLRQPPIREWDRDKIGEKSPGERARAARNRNRLSVSRSRSRSRGGGGAGGIGGVGDGRSPPLLNEGYGRRERDRDRNRGMDVRDRRDRKDRRKEEEEAPAKLLDDLFRKTKATPCIYWLPLTAEQINAKEEERRQRQVEREKRRQLEQAERDRNGNPNLEPNKRSRERQEDGRNRRRSASPIRARARRR